MLRKKENRMEMVEKVSSITFPRIILWCQRGGRGFPWSSYSYWRKGLHIIIFVLKDFERVTHKLFGINDVLYDVGDKIMLRSLPFEIL